MDDDLTTTLRPARGAAGAWTGVGVAATSLAIWVAVDARTSLVAWTFAALCVVVTSDVALQLAAPAWFTVPLGPAALEVRLPWQRRRVPWDRIHAARVVRVAGEPVLELHVGDRDAAAQDQPRGLGVVLPVGADRAALHRVLEQRLGRHPDPSGDVRTAN